jgi:class 3 adenylate cyclase
MAMIISMQPTTPEEAKVQQLSTANILTGFSDPVLAAQFASAASSSMSTSETKAFTEAMRVRDISSLLPQISSPTLVLFTYGFLDSLLPLTRDVARLIPDAELVETGAQGGSWQDLFKSSLDVADTFLWGEQRGESASRKPSSVEPGAFRTVLFTDVEGSTALTDRLGDARARDLLREHERITREALKAHGGSEVKTMGDGFMASFSSATKALECAIAIQSAFAQRNESAEEPIKVRIGLNAGEPIAEDDPSGRGDLFGASVNRAARIAAMAQGGEILVANVVRELAEGKEFLFNDRGDTELRGFEDPVRVYEVRWHD